MGVNSPAIVREITHVVFLLPFPQFCENVPHFVLDFEKKPTENRNNFQHRENILRAEIVRKLIRCAPKWYLHHLAQKCINITALRHSTPASFRLFKMAKRVGVVNVEEIKRKRREHSAFFSVNAHCQIVCIRIDTQFCSTTTKVQVKVYDLCKFQFLLPFFLCFTNSIWHPPFFSNSSRTQIPCRGRRFAVTW